MENKYYFVSYRWKDYNTKISEWQFANTTMTMHPTLWLKEIISNRTDYTNTYQIEFYEEITEKIFNDINGWIG